MKKRLLLKEGINCIDIGKKIANDNASFADTSNPWLMRGGDYNNGTNAGVFGSNNNDGNYNNNVSSRACRVLRLKSPIYCLKIILGIFRTDLIPYLKIDKKKKQ